MERRALSAWAHPACRSAASRFSASRASRDRGYDFATPPVDFPPPSGLHPGLHRPSEKARRTGSPLRGNPPGLCGSPAHEASAVFWLRGMPFPARARPAFLRLRRAGPRATSNADRVCFAPATLLSFLLQGFLFRPEIRDLVSEPVPPLLLGASGEPGLLSSEGLIPLVRRSPVRTPFSGGRWALALLVFLPSEALPSPAGELGFPSPSSFVLSPSPLPKGRKDGRDPGVFPAEDRFHVSSPKTLSGTGPSGVFPPFRRALP